MLNNLLPDDYYAILTQGRLDLPHLGASLSNAIGSLRRRKDCTAILRRWRDQVRQGAAIRRQQFLLPGDFFWLSDGYGHPTRICQRQ